MYAKAAMEKRAIKSSRSKPLHSATLSDTKKLNIMYYCNMQSALYRVSSIRPTRIKLNPSVWSRSFLIHPV